MRKYVLLLLLLTLCLAPLSIACAESFTFDTIFATCEIPEEYIVLTPDNLALHPEWVEKIAASQDALAEDFAERGVLLQAWTKEADACLEITAVKDALAQEYFDLDQQSTATRTAYSAGHTDGSYFGALGYKFTSATWKKTTRYGRFLQLRYSRDNAAGNVEGYMRRTIRNGYTITLDYQAVGRDAKTADNSALDKIMSTWSFTTTLPKPPEYAADLVFTAKPPMETNTGKFTVKGTGDAGLHIIGVVMRMSDPDPIILDTYVAKNGKFSLDVELPQEGVWLMTLTVENGDVVTEEVVFDTTLYQKNLLPVNLDEPLPTVLTGDTLTISGTTVKQTTVQCLVDGVYSKQVKTNNSGEFSFKIPTENEGDYQIVLVFTKKNYNSRRMTTTANRTFTEADIRADIIEQAVKPAYSTLTSKLSGYTGRYMHYNLYAVSIEQSGDQWLIFMAMTKKKAGYRDIVVVTSDKAPDFVVDAQVHLYLRCTGPYEVVSDDGTTTYPSFELMFRKE